MFHVRRVLEFTPRRMASGYAVFGSLWVLLSDRIVFATVAAESTLALVQTIKGWVFVGLSATLILGLTRVRERQLEDSRHRAITASQQLQVLHRIFRHNVRNDITVIRGYSQLLQEQFETDRAAAWLEQIRETAGQVIDTSEKLRIVSEVEVSEDRDVVDLVSIVDGELARFESQFPGVEVTRDLPERLPVQADTSIQYAIREALENAMEHHPDPPAERQISVTGDTSIGAATIEITDNGPGIPVDEVEPIESGDESQLSHGSGVGLWLIAWICQNYGGRVVFEPADGTTVALSFERADPIDEATDRLYGELTPDLAW
ncbi:HAMP domain-containing sensor histidine kinase [Halodesulfurarchaeum sp. HSR-GB]|uniref:sensor histidine kinase n=1 Tax=Halodesulfurarchaeum sp. HSR-GB TaxID=3074077 RepID=UPI002856EFE8|nr:HAMP domain-containing sensor histidine kinase [Halodesulfurarchaeum sp. HSR-GB]MDR5656161.1 HAMP domain-containing sensor histidine kinase [Halodesulfurarchaeum sp. HSR-GB]